MRGPRTTLGCRGGVVSGLVVVMFAARVIASTHTCTGVRTLREGQGFEVVWHGSVKQADVPRIVEDADDLEVIWEHYEIATRLPDVDFHEVVVVAMPVDTQCGVPTLGTATVCAEGGLAIGLGIGDPHCVADSAGAMLWIIAIRRSGLENRALTGPVCAETNWAVGAQCHMSVRSIEAVRRDEELALSPARRTIHWQAGLGAIVGSSIQGRIVLGGDAHGGIRGELRVAPTWASLFGDVVGLELRTRWFTEPTAPRESSWTLGLWPWLADRPRDPIDQYRPELTLFGVLIPEGGISIKPGSTVSGYLAWSAPLRWRPYREYYRTAPYEVAEHAGLELVPGLLWILGPGEQDVLFTLGLEGTLW